MDLLRISKMSERKHSSPSDFSIIKLYESSNMIGRAHMCPRVENIPDENIIEMIRSKRSQRVPELSGAVS